MEITVEREICSLTVHNSLVLNAEASCPLCGQSLDAGAPRVTDAPALPLQELSAPKDKTK